MGGHNPIQRLPLPEGIVCGMRREPVPKTKLLKAMLIRPVACGTSVQKILIIVRAPTRNGMPFTVSAPSVSVMTGTVNSMSFARSGVRVIPPSTMSTSPAVR